MGARAAGDGLRDNADVVDAGEAKRVHDGGKAAEGNGFIAAEEHAFLLVLQLIANSGAELMNIDGLVAEIDALSLIDGDDEAVLVDFLDGSRFWNVDLDARLENGAVIMKMMSSTRTTSTNGTMLISESEVCVDLESCGIYNDCTNAAGLGRPRKPRSELFRSARSLPRQTCPGAERDHEYFAESGYRK